jgi:putative GTP pyrophosphokinase
LVGGAYLRAVSPTFAPLPSKGVINRAGAGLVDFWASDLAFADLPWERQRELNQEIRIVSDFRTAHSVPLTKVTMSVRSAVKTERCTVIVGQRLKRLPRIVRKLHRQQEERGEASHLARLEDIGGCRAVLADGDELQRVLKRLRKNWGPAIKRERDYIAHPKPIGYRAVHVVVLRDDRRIEVQLRTQQQQFWADQIERVDARLGLNLKDGNGPPAMIEFFAAAGERSHALDYGLPVTDEMNDRLIQARRAVIEEGFYDG